MKKILTNLILAGAFLLLPISVFASGNITASPSSLSIEVGSSKTFTITATNTIGDVAISSSNTGVAKVSLSEWGTGMVEEGQTKTGTITVTGVSVGTATITLTLDAATFDAEDLAGQKRTITVTVVSKQNDNNTQTNKNYNNKVPAQNKSANNKIKELSVDGYELVKVDDKNYALQVSNDVTSINITATAEDSKAQITGTGKYELNVGENNIEVIVTSESGLQNKINVKVTRKDAFYLDDLDKVLDSSSIKDININADSKLSLQDLSKIKDSKKTINFNYNDENQKTLYSWSLDGSQIKDFDELVLGIDFKSDNSKEISKLSNYADGLYFSMKHKDILPSGTKIKLYVGDKYTNEDLVNIYYYNSKDSKLETIKEGLTINDGYVEFEVNKGSDYFVTMSKVNNATEVVTSTKSSSKLPTIIPISVIIIAIAVVTIYFIKQKKNNSKDNNNFYNPNSNNTI